MTVSINGTSGIVFNDASTQNTAATGFGFKNRIINGAMMIDQRNAGASVTVNGAGNYYATDRFACSGQATDGVFSIQRSTNAPTGFANSLLATITTADSSLGSTQRYFISQNIEGVNTADFCWGATAASAGQTAATVTLSFWVRSSVTGTFGGVLTNDGYTRSYPFTFSISVANTWEQKTVTVAGDTSGTWATDTSAGIRVIISLGAGSSYLGTSGSWSGSTFLSATGATNLISTNGATFYITGVQLEKGSTATSFDYRPYGTELALCQRYYYRTTFPASGIYIVNSALSVAATLAYGTNVFPVTLRDRPTALEQDGTAANYYVVRGGAVGQTVCSAVPAFVHASINQATTSFTVASGLTNGYAAQVYGNTSTTYLAWSAEL